MARLGLLLRQVSIFNAPSGAFLFFSHHLAHHLQNVTLWVAGKQQAIEVQIESKWLCLKPRAFLPP